MDQHDDVLIAGAGVIGLASALALIESGRRVRVIDAGRVGSGSSHGNCGTITPSHAPPLAAPGTVLKALKWMLTADAPLYIPPRFDPALWRWLMRFAHRCNTRDWRTSAVAKSALLNDSRARLADWVTGYGLACEFVESGEDYVFRDPRLFEHGHRELGLLRELGVSVEVIDGPRYETLEPALKPGVAGAIRFDGDAALRPDRYVDELARVVREKGGTIVEQCALQGVEHGRDGVRVRTAQGERRARDVVLAMGAWSPRLADAVGLPFLKQAMQPGKGYSITYSSPSLVPKRPLMLRDRSVCVTAWGSGFRLGSTMEFSGFDDTLNARRLGALERGAREYLHEPFGAERQEQWYGWRPMSCDDIPIIGGVPGRDGLWLATGHGMMGVGMSTGTGQLVADLIAGRAPAVDPTPYRMERFT
ncbi:NAD(P)/FAD-dependent oxidoreductase [Lysobacter niastensis]|uniref:FAD-dependent oxidoreductase n=1 Tax=Lysobacter niastensis TaxID=380629 RepID=A0ABS0B685_9GAMM|nr:FAD-dependent oxidoreductase [Lysobacter niastensis]MBF6023763.1 FAD-dependent oxidoreductase [Lysobacter niastensis]